MLSSKNKKKLSSKMVCLVKNVDALLFRASFSTDLNVLSKVVSFLACYEHEPISGGKFLLQNMIFIREGWGWGMD